MVRQHIRLLRFALLLADGITALGLFVLVSMVRFGAGWTETWTTAGAQWWVWAVGYAVLWAGAEWLQGLDQLRSRWTFRGEVTDILRAAFLLAVGAFSVLFLVHAPDVSRLFLVIIFASQVGLSIVQRRGIRVLLAIARRRGLGIRHLLVLGTGPDARAVAERLEHHPALAHRVVGYLGRPSASVPEVLGPLDAVETILGQAVVDELIAAFAADEVAYLEPVVALCQQTGRRVRVVLRPELAPISGGRVETLAGLEILTIASGPDRVLGLATKRMLDIGIAALALLVLAPILLLVSLAIWLDDRGPILFRQIRVGLHGRPFTMVKFRTMVPDAELKRAELILLNEISGPAFKLAADPRTTRVGRMLRRASIDELPQFWNVLRGQMSIVGPRPPLPDEVAGYDLWHRRRLSMKPGITGLWQVSARLEEEFDRWVELDLNYIDRWSLWLDLKIMARTVPAMLTGR
jgi:exopolysaccharide biosynthesis polyprenyl glycosylphosphotransferase